MHEFLNRMNVMSEYGWLRRFISWKMRVYKKSHACDRTMHNLVVFEDTRVHYIRSLVLEEL